MGEGGRRGAGRSGKGREGREVTQREPRHESCQNRTVDRLISSRGLQTGNSYKLDLAAVPTDSNSRIPRRAPSSCFSCAWN